MSAQLINKDIRFIDEEKIAICKKIRELTNGCEKRSFLIQSHVHEMGLSFLEEASKEILEFILRMEMAVTNGNLSEALIQTEIERAFISTLNV